MNRTELLRLYGKQYARTYDEKFLRSRLGAPDADYELTLLRRWLTPRTKWLDVACGTGFFLSHFPGIEREGLDLSPDMLAVAKAACPDVTFTEGSYLDPQPAWHNRWDFVSCMWYAYGLVDSMNELDRLVANLAAWTAPEGRCFVPLADPRLIAGVDLPYRLESPWPGETSITGIIWSYAEDDGTWVHAHQIAPHVEHMEMMFRRHFAAVELEVYPPAHPDWWGRRRALVAAGRRG